MKSKKRHTIYTARPAAARRQVRKTLNADALYKLVRQDFREVADHRATNAKIPLDDVMMAALAMFLLKDPSLLAFDQRRREDADNLRAMFGITVAPCDSQMRTVLDPLPTVALRSPFRSVFRALQRGKDFQEMAYIDGHYLLSGDGTGFYSSAKVASPFCLKKQIKNGITLYYQQMYAACFVHPDSKVVIPVYPEMITRQDGSGKQDSERKASKRFFREFRREHPHLPVIVVEDALSSNGPHIRELQQLGLRFILGAKPADHVHLFAQLDQATADGTATEHHHLDATDRKIAHFYRFANGVALNKENPKLLVNVLEYSQIDENEKITTFSWVTDLEITKDNVHQLMRAGRARWKIENETFNTLKNQGYHLEHNYGLGKKNLSAVFTILMMLAFLIDQAQQMSCWLFKAALAKKGRKRYLWEDIRSFYRNYQVDSMEDILRAIAFGFEKRPLKEEQKT
jgi:hypothetical protein